MEWWQQVKQDPNARALGSAKGHRKRCNASIQSPGSISNAARQAWRVISSGLQRRTFCQWHAGYPKTKVALVAKGFPKKNIKEDHGNSIKIHPFWIQEDQKQLHHPRFWPSAILFVLGSKKEMLEDLKSGTWQHLPPPPATTTTTTTTTRREEEEEEQAYVKTCNQARTITTMLQIQEQP